jgi:hypothetical protein
MVRPPLVFFLVFTLPHSISLCHHSPDPQEINSSALGRSWYSRKKQTEWQRFASTVFPSALPLMLLIPSDAAKALLAVKSLGRDPSGSEFLARPDNLSALLSLSTSYKDDPDASLESLRCIANALLLIETSRETFLKPPVNGGDFCLNALEVCCTSSFHLSAFSTTGCLERYCT